MDIKKIVIIDAIIHLCNDNVLHIFCSLVFGIIIKYNEFLKRRVKISPLTI